MLFVALFMFAARQKHQVTSPVLEVNANTIVVKKGNDNRVINRDTAAKVAGDLKVGSKVTIEYTMKAVSVEVKAEGKKADSKKK